MSDYSKLKWGDFELENATRKNSDCGVFGQKHVRVLVLTCEIGIKQSILKP